MRTLEDVNNSKKISSIYPYGGVKDKSITESGTSITESLIGDFIVTLEKIKADSNIKPNHLPDNEANGYQLLDSFKAIFAQVKDISKFFKEVGDSLKNKQEAITANKKAIDNNKKEIDNSLDSIKQKLIPIGNWQISNSSAFKRIGNINDYKEFKDSNIVSINAMLIFDDSDFHVSNSLVEAYTISNGDLFVSIDSKIDTSSFNNLRKSNNNRGYIIVKYVEKYY